MKGSTTLEAAIVIPIVLICIIVLVYVVFYLHDETMLSGLADEYLQTYTSLEPYSGNKGIYQNPVQISKRTMENTNLFLIGSWKDIDIAITSTSYPIYTEATITITLPVKFFVYDDYLIVRRKRIVTSGSEIVRVIECINDISSDFVPLNQIKIEYNQVIKGLLDAIKD